MTALGRAGSAILAGVLAACGQRTRPVEAPRVPPAARATDLCERARAEMTGLPAAGGLIDLTHERGSFVCAVNPFSAARPAGVLRLPAAAIRLFTSLPIPSNWTVQGIRGGRPIPGTGADAGTTLVWMGRAGDAAVIVRNAHHVQIRDLSIANARVGDAIGLRLDSTNHPPTHNVLIDGINIYDFEIGVQWGTAHLDCPRTCTDRLTGNFEVDKVHLARFNITSRLPGSEGIVIASGNAAQDSSVSEGYVRAGKVAIDVQLAGYTTFKRISAAVDDPKGSVFSLTVANSIILEQCESEMPDDGRAFIRVPPSCCGSTNGTLVLVGNAFGNDVVIEHPVQVVSLGNWGHGVGRVAALETHVTSLGDTFGPGHTGRWQLIGRATENTNAVATLPAPTGDATRLRERAMGAIAGACLSSGSGGRYVRKAKENQSCVDACRQQSGRSACVEGWTIDSKSAVVRTGRECREKRAAVLGSDHLEATVCCCASATDAAVPLFDSGSAD